MEILMKDVFWGCTSVIECLPTVHKALSSITRTAKDRSGSRALFMLDSGDFTSTERGITY